MSSTSTAHSPTRAQHRGATAPRYRGAAAPRSPPTARPRRRGHRPPPAAHPNRRAQGHRLQGVRPARPVHHHPAQRRQPPGLPGPGRAGANTAHFTFFTKSGSEQPIDGANATMATPIRQATEHRPAAAHRQPLRRQPQPSSRIDDLHHQRHPPRRSTHHRQLHPADQVTGGRHRPKTPPPQHRRPGPCLAGRAAPGRLRRIGRWLLRLGGRPGHQRPAARPASTAKLIILIPHNGQTVHSPTPEVRLGLNGAKIASARPRPASGPTRATSTCWSTTSWSP